MARQPKPYYRKSQKRWVCHRGNRITLGENKKQAFEKYHALMLNRQAVKAKLCTISRKLLKFFELLKTKKCELLRRMET